MTIRPRHQHRVATLRRGFADRQPTDQETEQQVIAEEQDTASNDNVSRKAEAAARVARQTADSASDNVQGTASRAGNRIREAASSAMDTAQDAFADIGLGAGTGRERGFRGDRGERTERRAPPTSPSMQLYVGNLFFDVTPQILQEEFGKYGNVVNTKIVEDHRGLSKG